MEDTPTPLAGLIGRTITDAWYDPVEQVDIIDVDDTYRLRHYRHPAKQNSMLLIADDPLRWEA